MAGTTFTVRWADQNAAGDPPNFEQQFIWKSKRLGRNLWSPATLMYSARANPPPNFNLAVDFIDGVSMGVNVESQATNAEPPMMLSITQNSVASEQFFSVPGNVAPIQVDPIDTPEAWDTFTVSQGPYLFGGSYWLIGNLTFAFGPGLLQMCVLKSTNFNPTTGTGAWTRMDQAHEPANVVVFDGQYDGSNRFLRFLTNTTPFSGGNAGYSLIEFDMNAGQWTAAHDAVTLPVQATAVGAMIFSNPANKTGLFYGSAPNNLYAYFDGAWHTGFTAVSVPGGPGFTFIRLVLLDPTNGTRLHSVYSSTTNMHYQQISITGILGPDFDFGSNAGFNSVGCPGHSVIFTDADGIKKIGLMVDWDLLANGDLSPACFIGYPLSNPDFNAEGLLTNPLGPGHPGPEIISHYPGDRATCTYGSLIGIAHPPLLTLTFKGQKVYSIPPRPDYLS